MVLFRGDFIHFLGLVVNAEEGGNVNMRRSCERLEL